jgi:tetratricopeptide (TPR) repeat protein
MSMAPPLLLVALLCGPAWPLIAAGQQAGTMAHRSTGELIDAARAAARADRNRESADLFAQAIQLSPQRRRELLQEYADQLNYSGRSAQAAPLYEEVLRSPLSRDERLHALKGLGLAFLWTDRPSRARPVFEALLREQPGDQDAARNLGRALSWSGRQREAAAHLALLLQQHPDDAEARVVQAQAQAWMGRPDTSAKTLDGLAALRDDARMLAAELNRARAPRTNLEAQQSSQSDQLDIRSQRLGHAVVLADGRASVGARVDRIAYEREDGSDSALVIRPMVQGRYRFNDALEVNADLGRERIAARGTPAADPTVYSSWLTWWPSDLLRFDLSTNRGTFDNLQSLRLALTSRQQGLSMDFTPSERERYTVRVEHANYSDGNARRSVQLETEYRWRTHPDAWIGLRHTRFEFDRQLDHGYFNPLTFESTLLTLRSLWHPGGPQGRWELAAYVAAGREHAVPDGGKPASDVSMRLAYRLDTATRVEVRAQRFSSRTASSGFARSIFALALDRTW